jgi:hypothetical protein
MTAPILPLGLQGEAWGTEAQVELKLADVKFRDVKPPWFTIIFSQWKLPEYIPQNRLKETCAGKLCIWV